jgi:hypothetical protein
MEMMNSMMGSDAMNASSTAAMGSNLPLSLMVALVLAVALGYVLGAGRRARAQA